MSSAALAAPLGLGPTRPPRLQRRPGPVATHRPATVPRRVPAATYRRRRLAALGLVLVAAALVLAAALALVPRAASGAAVTVPAAALTHVVQPGDTLWSIAESLAPGADLRPVVDALAAANGGAALVPGQRLVLALP